MVLKPNSGVINTVAPIVNFVLYFLNNSTNVVRNAYPNNVLIDATAKSYFSS